MNLPKAGTPVAELKCLKCGKIVKDVECEKPDCPEKFPPTEPTT